MTLPTLYHFTCEHSRLNLGDDGRVVPGAYGLAWFTTLPYTTGWRRAALGLTSRMLTCDRTQFRYRVVTSENPPIVPYLSLPIEHRIDLLEVPPARPELWWVSFEPVRVVIA